MSFTTLLSAQIKDIVFMSSPVTWGRAAGRGNGALQRAGPAVPTGGACVCGGVGGGVGGGVITESAVADRR